MLLRRSRLSASTLLLALVSLTLLGQFAASASEIGKTGDDLLGTRHLQDASRVAHPNRRRRRAPSLLPYNEELSSTTLQFGKRQAEITAEDTTDPVAAAQAVQALPYLANNASGVTDTASQIVQGDSDEAQLPWNSQVPFIATPNTNATAAGGWEALPQTEGFTLNRTWQIVPGAVMPFYITSGIDPSAVKRAVITFPGKPRDAWKYANLYRNALAVVYANETYGVANDSVLIVSPVWLNELDQQGGAVEANELYFEGSNWEAGGSSRGPPLKHSITTYAVMDNFTDMLFDKTQYPNLNQVVIAGHSMGGQAAHRYAILKKQKAYDPNMSFWVGNPGSWTYLNDKRPYNNQSCTSTFNAWHYGLAQNLTLLPKYARADVQANVTEVVDRYIKRKIHMALGLLDNGPGDTHCEARDQGGNHLDRGSQYVLHLNSVNNGTFPPSQTVDFIGNTSHQDFAMMSANVSLNWLFVNDYNVRYPDIVPQNPAEQKHKATELPLGHHAYATRGNTVLASSLLGGSFLLIVAFFTTIPFIFRDNFDERAFVNETQNRTLAKSAALAPDFARFRKDGMESSVISSDSSPSIMKADIRHEYPMLSR